MKRSYQLGKLRGKEKKKASRLLAEVAASTDEEISGMCCKERTSKQEEQAACWVLAFQRLSHKEEHQQQEKPEAGICNFDIFPSLFSSGETTIHFL